VWHTKSQNSIFFGSDGRIYCGRRVGEEFLPENVSKMVKHGGGSIQVWGCLSYQGPERLYRVEGRMNAVQYTSILEEAFLGSLSDRKTHRFSTI
jgi:hypothetical protein